MNPLVEILRQRILLSGPITIADYMSSVLLHPKFGYYSCKDPLGSKGDFITSPEISQMFGELIGLWCASTWYQMGKPDNIRLIELGPGRGTLMKDALRALRVVPEFLDAIDIHLVEASIVLQTIQQNLLSYFDITWHQGIETLPDGPILLFGNEFLDALPIRQLICLKNSWHERLIDFRQNKLSFSMDNAPSALITLLPSNLANSLPDNTLLEVSPVAIGMISSISNRIKLDGGAALFIDYGHLETTTGQTLQALRGHLPIDVLTEPGTADLTAHVDFKALAKAASEICVHGPLEQGLFLERLGITPRLNTLSKNSSKDFRDKLILAHRRLTAPEEMGTSFKVMAFTTCGAPVPAGFE